MACFSLIVQLVGWVSQAIFIAVNSVLFICSVIGNSLVIFLVWSKDTLKSPTYILMSFLAISDLLTSLLGQSLFCISVNIRKSDLNCYMVKALVLTNIANCTCSVLLLSLIARDRHLRVSKHQSYLDHTSNRFAIIASLTCHLFGIVVASLSTFDDRIMKISGYVAFIVLGTCSFIYICIKSRQIAEIVKEHIKQMEASCQNTSVLEHFASTRSFQLEKLVNRSIFYVIILFFVSWTPVIILMIIIIVLNIRSEPITDEYRIAFVWGSTAVYLNGALNNIIYSYRCDAIGREIRKTLAKAFRRTSVAPHLPSTRGPTEEW